MDLFFSVSSIFVRNFFSIHIAICLNANDAKEIEKFKGKTYRAFSEWIQATIFSSHKFGFQYVATALIVFINT